MRIDRFAQPRMLLAMGLAATLTVAAAAGCGYAPASSPPGAEMPVPDDTADTPERPDGVLSFSRDLLPLLVQRCSVCHIDGGIADLRGIALRLTEDLAYDAMVSQPSVQGDFTLVVPGDAEGSLVYLKVLLDTPPVGTRMPLFGPFLDDDDIALIREWIDQGALDN